MIYVNINALDKRLCFYHKKLWSKCKNLWTFKLILGYWVSNGSAKDKDIHPSHVKVIWHIVDLGFCFLVVSGKKNSTFSEITIVFVNLIKIKIKIY